MKLDPIPNIIVSSNEMAFPMRMPFSYKKADSPNDYPSFSMISFLFSIVISIFP
jgi:hypothetical protein